MDEKSNRDGAPVSLAEVAQAAGVSVSTVSRVVNGLTHRAGRQTAARVMEEVERLGYRPNLSARSLRRRESRIVAMLSPNLDNPAMAAIAASTEAALRDAGYVMILCDTHDRADLQDEYLEAMRAQMARGYVLVSAVASPGLAAAMRRGDALVFVNRRNPMGAGAFVGADNRGIGADAAESLAARGLDHAATLAPERSSSTIAERLAGFKERWRALGRSAPRLARADGPDHLAIGAAAIDRLLAAGGWPQALFCPSDLIAYAVYRRACADGREIPRDCLVIGVDGNALNHWIAPWLASYEIPYKSFGSAVVEALMARWDGRAGGDRILPHRLWSAASAPDAAASPVVFRRPGDILATS